MAGYRVLKEEITCREALKFISADDRWSTCKVVLQTHLIERQSMKEIYLNGRSTMYESSLDRLDDQYYR